MRTETRMMDVQEYIQYELNSELRHEYINGILYEMPGEKKINNKIAFAIAMLLYKQLHPAYAVYNHDVKVAIPGGRKYYYPDVCIVAEPEDGNNEYILTAPTLIVEVVSESSQTHDYVDKYLDYITIPGLQYYLIAEPETILVTVYERDGDVWTAHKYTRLDSTVELPKLGVQLSLSEIYKGISFA